jgi:hypothetical protein
MLRDFLVSCALYYLTLLPVVLGVCFGVDYLIRREYYDFPGFAISQPPRGDYLDACANWDGVWYADIARQGYTFDPQEGSYVIFFPGFPLLGRALSRLTGVEETGALVFVANLSLFGSIVMFRAYLRHRYSGCSERVVDLATVLLLTLPSGVFFRLAYSESLFLLCMLLGMYGIARGWTPWISAVAFGAATGVRAVGIGLIVVWAWYAWRYTKRDSLHAFEEGGGLLWSRLGRLCRVLAALPVSAWGLCGYMYYLWAKFGDGLIFQSHHAQFDALSNVPMVEKLVHVVTLEPMWSVYTGRFPIHWSSHEAVLNPIFTLRFMNPLFFGLSVVLTVIGVLRRWLSVDEAVLCAVMLGIPYVTKGHDGGMLGMARYSSVVFPTTMVMALLLVRLPECARWLIVALFTTLVAFYAALFAAWHIVV